MSYPKGDGWMHAHTHTQLVHSQIKTPKQKQDNKTETKPFFHSQQNNIVFSCTRTFSTRTDDEGNDKDKDKDDEDGDDDYDDEDNDDEDDV